MKLIFLYIFFFLFSQCNAMMTDEEQSTFDQLLFEEPKR